MSCGTAPSLQHSQRTSCKGCNSVVLQCLIRSGGIPSLPGAFLEAKLLIALSSSAIVGSLSSSPMTGRNFMASRVKLLLHSIGNRVQSSVPPISPSVVPCLC